ncbi:MAG: thioredoxin domain-containing protein [Candidatus Bipolaricaulia bacterium]
MTRKKSGRFFLNPILIVIVAAVLLAAALIAASQLSARQRQQIPIGPQAPQPGQEQPSTSTQPVQPQQPVAPITAVTAQPTKGSPDAPVTIIEFAEFYCPFCARYLWETYPKIERDYINKGLVRYEFLNLIVHGPVALLTAVAGECAHEQGKFWPLHDRLFESTFPGRNLSQPQELKVADLERLAGAVGLDQASFNSCLESYDTKFNSCFFDYNNCTAGGTDRESCAAAFNICLAADPMFQKVLEDQEELGRLIEQLPPEEEAQAQRIGTPTFFINGHILIGAQPYENFKSAIERELAKAGGK